MDIDTPLHEAHAQALQVVTKELSKGRKRLKSAFSGTVTGKWPFFSIQLEIHFVELIFCFFFFAPARERDRDSHFEVCGHMSKKLTSRAMLYETKACLNQRILLLAIPSYR
jgi:hypothetical protein